MKNSESLKFYENSENVSENEIELLDKILDKGELWQPKNKEILGSLQVFSESGEVKKGDAYVLKNTVLVEQGSFVLVNKKRHILSPDFSRCVGLVIQNKEGILVAHSTEYNNQILDLFDKYGSVDQSYVFLPEDPPKELDISTKERLELQNLRQTCQEKKLNIITYPWSDFPPSDNQDEKGYILSVSSEKIAAIPTKISKDDSEKGYHHQSLNEKPILFSES